VVTTLTPFSAIYLNSSATLREVLLSSPVVGSSKKIILGFVSNSTPIEVLFFYPPEIPFIKTLPIMVSAHSIIPNSFSKLLIFSVL